MTAQPPHALKSYICGEWKAGTRDGVVLRDAGTGAPVATIDASGLNMAEALDHGRRSGAALRAMTFHQRAEMLKALG
ncbi:MAG: phenylacetic acid degradation bifunctional protein PaaZ, partial [Rhodobacteraceae bacterium]|nr:phenylacetic acid degradation bifunctional protein PaaZ [Paracoccaceae bacterium]